VLVVSEFPEPCSYLIITLSCDLLLEEHLKTSHSDTILGAAISIKEVKFEVLFSQLLLTSALVEDLEFIVTQFSSNEEIKLSKDVFNYTLEGCSKVTIVINQGCCWLIIPSLRLSHKSSSSTRHYDVPTWC
jgi:hypothetical protein